MTGESHPNYRADVTIDSILNLRGDGLTIKQIASRLGCDRNVVGRRIKVGLTNDAVGH